MKNYGKLKHQQNRQPIRRIKRDLEHDLAQKTVSLSEESKRDLEAQKLEMIGKIIKRDLTIPIVIT
jgi:hypothetical protein